MNSMLYHAPFHFVCKHMWSAIALGAKTRFLRSVWAKVLRPEVSLQVVHIGFQSVLITKWFSLLFDLLSCWIIKILKCRDAWLYLLQPAQYNLHLYSSLFFLEDIFHCFVVCYVAWKGWQLTEASRNYNDSVGNKVRILSMSYCKKVTINFYWFYYFITVVFHKKCNAPLQRQAGPCLHFTCKR